MLINNDNCTHSFKYSANIFCFGNLCQLLRFSLFTWLLLNFTMVESFCWCNIDVFLCRCFKVMHLSWTSFLLSLFSFSYFLSPSVLSFPAAASQTHNGRFSKELCACTWQIDIGCERKRAARPKLVSAGEGNWTKTSLLPCPCSCPQQQLLHLDYLDVWRHHTRQMSHSIKYCKKWALCHFLWHHYGMKTLHTL